MMSKRPYYIIMHDVDCDGYYTYIDYIGHNAKAALERFRFMVQDIRNNYFELNGDDEIYYGGIECAGLANLKAEELDGPGREIIFYINDDSSCWITIKLIIVETGQFLNYPIKNNHRYGYGTVQTDNRRREEMYKSQYPNSKY